MSTRRDFLRQVLAAAAPLAALKRANGAQWYRFPQLQNVSESGATILWASSTPGEGQVEYVSDSGSSGAAAASVRELTPDETDLEHSIYLYKATVEALAPGARHSYHVCANGQKLTPDCGFSLRTPGGAPFKFVAFGDSGMGTTEQWRIAELMAREEAALALHLGDIAYPVASFREFQYRHFDVYGEWLARVPLFPCPGNHEYYTRDGFPYFALHTAPASGRPETEPGRYYSFDWGTVHFVALDSNRPLERAAAGKGPMLEWLDKDLAATKKPWKVVYFHHPPFAAGPNEQDPLSILARRSIVPILEKHRVQLVLNGHEHSYQRSYPVRAQERAAAGEAPLYLTSGGGGAFLYAVHASPLVEFGRSTHHYLRVEVERERMVASAIDSTGEMIDRVEVLPGR